MFPIPPQTAMVSGATRAQLTTLAILMRETVFRLQQDAAQGLPADPIKIENLLTTATATGFNLVYYFITATCRRPDVTTDTLGIGALTDEQQRDL